MILPRYNAKMGRMHNVAIDCLMEEESSAVPR
jgi:hypothetical protein